MRAVCRHRQLPSALYVEVAPARFKQTRLIFQNTAWAKRLGLEGLLADEAGWLKHFAQFTPIKNSCRKPLALCYHGHQFGIYNPDLGDGRGFLYAQVIDPASDRLLDFGTKGSGQTPFSRDGDGRLTLKGAVRELLATSMLDALGVETSQTFSIVETDESLQRSDEPSPTRAAVLTRLSHGHIRVGTFQRLAYLGDTASLEALIRYSLDHYANVANATTLSIAEASELLLGYAIKNIARVTGAWMAAGFVHGVLNTDNYNITGESFDYGPWRFLPRLIPEFTAAYFDHRGRYCYGRQPEVGLWTLTRLAECLTGFVAVEVLKKQLADYQTAIDAAITEAVLGRLGIDANVAWADGGRLAMAFLKALREAAGAAEAEDGLGFEVGFFDWYGGAAGVTRAMASPRASIYKTAAFTKVAELLPHAPQAPSTKAALQHPYFAAADAKPETMLIDQVEALWQPIADNDDWQPLAAKLKAIAAMGEALADNGNGVADNTDSPARLLGKDI